MKESIRVSNLTLDLWLDFVRPALRSVNMLDEAPAKDEWHEYTAEVIDAETAKEIEHCMTVACFNAHAANKYTSIEEAKQMLYQIDASIEYRTDTREALSTLREAIAAKIAETTDELKGANTMMQTKQRAIKELVAHGHAIDITNHDGYMQEQLETLEGKLDCIAYSHGVYGVNGLLLKGRNTGSLYAITTRSSAIFLYL